MATQSFDGSIKVNKKSAKSFDTILNSKKRTTISKIPLSWYETYFGEDVFDPRKKRKQERK